MNTVDRAKKILQDAESELRQIAAEAATQGDYEALGRIADWARDLGRIAVASNYLESAFGVQEATAEPHAPAAASSMTVSTGGVTGKKSQQRVKLPDKIAMSRGAPEAKKYPVFLRDGEFLVKIGWSKASKSTYEHRAQFAAVESFARAVELAVADQKSFTMEDLSDRVRLPDGEEPPAYQLYVTLAWMVDQRLLEKLGRRGYRVVMGKHLLRDVQAAWKLLPRV